MSDGAAISPAQTNDGRSEPRTGQAASSPGVSERNRGIDALRGVSILFVIMNHIGIRIPLAKTALAAWLPAWLLRGLNWNGYEAVFIFFVISGFLITRRSLERWGTLGNISLRGFYWFRATRILPCLLLTIFCYSLFHLLGVPSFVINKPDQSLVGAIASALGLYLNWYEAHYGYLAGGWDVLWSLSIEEVFYLAFPLACLTLGGTRLFVPVLILFALTLQFEHAWLHTYANEIWQEKAYLPGMTAIAIGVLAALLANRVAPRARWIGVVCCIAGLTGLGAVFFAGKFVFHWLQDGYMLLLTGAAASLTLGFHWLDRTASEWRLRGLGWLRSCGRLSYEIYLFHMFIVFPIVALAKSGILGAEWGWLWYPPTVALSWLLGLAVARGYSLPCERWLRRRFAPAGTRPLTVQTAVGQV